MPLRIERVYRADDQRAKDYRDLVARRRAADVFVAESGLVVRRLLRAPRFRTRSLLLTEPALVALNDAIVASPDDPTVLLATAETISAVVAFRFHRGCLALGSMRRPLDAGAFGIPSTRLLLALERVSNPDNLGSLFRNAAAFGVDGVLLSPGCGDPLHRKVVRVSMGAVFDVPFARVHDWPAVLERLRATGAAVVALTPDATARDLATLPATDRTVLLLGSEGHGLTTAALATADVAVRIAMAPGVDSLNVNSAAAIALHRLTTRPA